jgi:glycosyltransferase involved in cell wall biosynthesis
MIGHKLYYGLKPMVPLYVRRAVRRWSAERQRRKAGDSWYILPGSERQPPGWPGWPGGKKFAFVLTHDVEGQNGVDRCLRLMELDRKLGFRSAFNFIPEGNLPIPKELRDKLTANGFEVGVHDLRHDGKLFAGRREFAAKATRINRYIKEWGAAGFRAGFMFHNLEWLHDLDIQYDASTFDVDPFEPQPDGAGTIFPFWKAGPQDRGYVELPYTLPQDSTLFLLFEERGPDIWLRKLDWIAEHGGMALVNVHPDYIRFEGEKASYKRFPVDYYARLLEYVAKKYGDVVWRALPSEVAAFVAPLKTPAPYMPKRVCMVTYSGYLTDARVTRYAEALAQRGDHVDVLSLRQFPSSPDVEVVNKVNIIRLQSRYGKKEKGVADYLVPILSFLLSSSWWIARRHHEQPYDVLHIHNIPDFLVFAGLYPRITGAKVILDIHDIVPEFYSSKFAVRQDSLMVAVLKLVERISSKQADHIIISNHLWLDKYSSRTGANGRCSVFINNVNTEIFRPGLRKRNDERFLIIFPGGLQWHQGLDIALRAFQKVSPQAPSAEFHIYGDGNMKQQLIDLAAELGLNGKVKFFDPRPVREIAQVMSDANLGVVPKRADSFGNEAYSTKIMEFMSVGVPVIVSETRIDRYYFNDSVVRFFESGNHEALAEAIMEMIRNREAARQMVERASAYAAENNWETRKVDYLRLVDQLGAACSPAPTVEISRAEISHAH